MSEESVNNGGAAERQRGIRLTVLAIVAVGIVLVAGFFYAATRARMMTAEELKSQGAYLYENPRTLPNFSLLNDRGETLTPISMEGKWNLIFFGFTYCPDVCPTTLAQLKAFYQELEPEVQADTQIWLTSVDPARDTPEQLHSYLDFFHPAFRGITGDFLEIHRFATSLNIPFTKVPGGGSNYQVEHSANVALVNPNGHSVGFFKAPLEISKLKRAYLSIREYH
ncbi:MULTISPECIES: SCO family protein [Zhongshania]|jgi:protein SCO1/2|uniref:Protein SCO1/2 n=1 Tax=Zhongshania antarctica TaxID=641702 RepID=A0A840R664_9GAMM|nr:MULTISPECIES: SCO family protein [Zhongshania]MBB5187902.1 protein SCO1/2 [Zhongshania antarctica]